jgi:hypothetical protein
MKHPVRSDFDTAVGEAGVTVTFRPTNSILRMATTLRVLVLSHWNALDTLEQPAILRVILPMKSKRWRNASLQRSPPRFGWSKARKRPID